MATQSNSTITATRSVLRTSVSVSALLLLSMGQFAIARDIPASPAPIPAIASSAVSTTPAARDTNRVEKNRYFMRLMTQIFDGAKDFSHTQVASFGRERRGNQSWTMIDFGDGAVVINKPGTVAASGFTNTSPTEFGMLYDYDTQTISGNRTVAHFHNQYVRPQLNMSPDLGRDVSWSTSMPLTALGIDGLAGGNVKIELSREYFSHNGKDLVLIQYQVPAITFDPGTGAKVVHWGRGFALSDPGFGDLYASVSLHRSVADEGGTEARPYRYFRAQFASDNTGKRMIDLKKIPAVAKIYDAFFGQSALAVIPFGSGDETPDQSPIALAGNLDIMALSIAENGANDNGGAAAAQIGAGRGQELPVDQINDLAQTVSTTNQIGQGLTFVNGVMSQLTVSQLAAVEQKATSLAAKGEQLAQTVISLDSNVQNAQNVLLESAKTTVKMTPPVANLQTLYQAASAKVVATSNELDAITKTIDDLSVAGQQVPTSMLAQADALEAKLLTQSNDMKQANAAFATAAEGPNAFVKAVDLTDPDTLRLMDNYTNAVGEYKVALNAVEQFGEESQDFVTMFKNAPAGTIANLAKKFGDSKAGKFLEKLGHAMNGLAVVKSGSNIYTASTNNIGSGPTLPLTRDYATVNADGTTTGLGGAALGFVMDVAGLAGNALSLNAPAFLSDATAITLGSVSDMVIAYKGTTDIEAIKAQIEKDALYIQTQETERVVAREAAKMKDLKDNPVLTMGRIIGDTEDPYENGYNLQNPNIDSETGLPDPAYWTYLKENEPQTLRNMGIDPEAPVGGWPDDTEASQAADQMRARNAYNAGANERLTEAAEYDYPTVPAYDPASQAAKPEPEDDSFVGQTSELSPRQLADIETAKRRTAYQQEQDDAQAARVAELGLPDVDSYATAAERQAGEQKKLDDAQAARVAALGLPDLDTYATAAERQAAEQKKQDDAQAARVAELGLPDIDTYATAAERQAAEQDKLDDAVAARVAELDLPDIDIYATPAERQAAEQKKQDDAQAARAAELELPDVDTYATAAERQAGEQKKLDDAQAARVAELDLPDLDQFETPAERKAAADKSLADRDAALLEAKNAKADEADEDAALAQLGDYFETGLAPLNVSQFNLEPIKFEEVNFDMPEWTAPEFDMPVWTSPEWAPPEFSSPLGSIIDFTSFDGSVDDNFLGFASVVAFQYEDMSGTVATDLDKWGEWLATQNVNELERMALRAGYPNLASALADADNLIRDANDQGWRQWAMAPPSCNGPSGCGPQYLERWGAKRSRLGLGDILSADREFFSTGGLSDVSIAALTLMFSIRDFGLEDGDRVSIAVRQFGQSLLAQSLTLTNAGNSFNVPVRQGVVSVNVTALNTGDIPPNTAALSIDGVTGGDANQSYSLDQGGGAGLKVSVGGSN